MAKWRSEGKRVALFLDDGLGFNELYNFTAVESYSVRSDLLKAGFILADHKCFWEPSHHCIWLGIEIDLAAGLFKIPKNRIQNAVEDLKIFNVDRPFVRKVASITGKIISMQPIIGNVAYLMTRSLSQDIASSNSWNSRIKLCDQSVSEIKFWKSQFSSSRVNDLTSCKIRNTASCTAVVYSDASDTGYGAYSVSMGDFSVHGEWSFLESIQSSTFRELLAVKNTLSELKPEQLFQRIKWFTDNANTARIISSGSMRPHLHNIAVDIFSFCSRFGISIEPEWIPRTNNEYADYLSKIVDYDDWAIADHVFSHLNALWGPFSIDRFASRKNRKLIRYNSRFFERDSEGVDTFAFDWKDELNWAVPPPSLGLRTLQHMQNCRAVGVVVLPYWPAACQHVTGLFFGTQLVGACK